MARARRSPARRLCGNQEKGGQPKVGIANGARTRVVIYARVSTGEQSVEPQLRDLREYVAARGWQATEYLDQGVSETKEKRPGLDRLLRDVKARKIDVVVVAAFDRFGRSVRHLVECLDLFRHLGAEFVSLRESIDTGSPLGQAVFTIVAAIAQLERSLIAERARAGLRRAKADGKRLGRPPLQVNLQDLDRVIRTRLSVREAARELGISPSACQRLLQARQGGVSSGSLPVRGLIALG